MADDLVALLLAAGVSHEDVEAASEDGMLLALLADRYLLPGRRAYTLDTAAAAAGMASADAKRLWRALGFPPAARGCADLLGRRRRGRPSAASQC